MCTAALQDNLPDWMTSTEGHTITVAPDNDSPRSISGSDVPLVVSPKAAELAILRRRERIKQAQDHPGSHIPTSDRTRQDIMDELT